MSNIDRDAALETVIEEVKKVLTAKQFEAYVADPTEAYQTAVKSEFRAYGKVQAMTKHLYMNKDLRRIILDTIDTYHDGQTTSNRETMALRKRVIDSTKALKDEGLIPSVMTVTFKKVMTADGVRKFAQFSRKKTREPVKKGLLEEVAGIAKEHSLSLKDLAMIVLTEVERLEGEVKEAA